MTYVKNICPINTLSGNSLDKAQFHEVSDVSHLCVLGSIIYILIHEEEQDLKSEKFEAQTRKNTLVGYNRHIIYMVHLCDQEKFIQVKDLCIFEDIFQKASTTLLIFDNQPTF